jgi:PTH2 family peptidyl-tRNA hydrolase
LNAILRTKQFDEENRYMMKLSLTYDEVYWIMTDYAKVVLQCDSLRDIETIERLCNEAMIPCSVVTDNGTTEFHGIKTVTCISVGPYQSEEINKITSGYKLL